MRKRTAVRMYTATHRARLHQVGELRPHSQKIRQTWAAPNTSMPGTKLISSRASAAVHSRKNQKITWAKGFSPARRRANPALPTARKLPAHLATRLSRMRRALRR